MSARLMVFALGALGSLPVSAQTTHPNSMTLAQANDRCMVTYAVRLTKTDATDEVIYADATAGCIELQTQLADAITREYAVDRAKELNAMLRAQAKPNFMAMLQKIRTDRLNRTGN